MEIDHCLFPDDLLYDVDNNTWTRVVESGEVVVGVTSILSSVAGRLTSARLKPLGLSLERGRSLGTLESIRFVGPIPSPFSGTIVAANEEVVVRPKVLNDAPYGAGWVVRLKPSSFRADKTFLTEAKDAEEALREKVVQLKARCFKAYPDHEMFEVGVECAAVLVRLNDLIATLSDGEVVHVVSDDTTAYVEMERWVDQTRNELVDWRTESNLFHFIVRKTAH